MKLTNYLPYLSLKIIYGTNAVKISWNQHMSVEMIKVQLKVKQVKLFKLWFDK